MAPTRSSSNKKTASVPDDSSPNPSTTLVDTSPAMEVPLVPTSARFDSLLESIRDNQVTIQALMSKLDVNSVMLDNTSAKLMILYDQVQTMHSTVTDTIPKDFNNTLDTAKHDFRHDITTAITDFLTTVYQDIRTHHSESLQCFKTQAIGISHLTAEIADLSKTLSTVQDTALSKLDVERIVVQKWQDELDPHIQSHYDLKKDVTDRFSTLDRTIKSTVDSTIDNHPILSQLTSSSPTHSTRPRPPASSSVGFHQADSKDFSVSKLQKELKDLKLFGDSLKELELFWMLFCEPLPTFVKCNFIPTIEIFPLILTLNFILLVINFKLNFRNRNMIKAFAIIVLLVMFFASFFILLLLLLKN
jgi:hypothetical protein